MNIKRIVLITASLGIALASSAQAQSAPNISTTDITTSGLSASTGLQNAVSNTYFVNDGRTLLIVKGGGSAVTGTAVTQAGTISQAGYGTVSLTNQTFSVPSGAVVVVGPFPQGRWNNAYGNVAVSFTSVTGVSATAIRLPR